MGFMKRNRYGSVKAMAEKLGINRVYLSSVLRGDVQPSISLAKKLAKITGRSFFNYRPDLKKIIKELL
jgi:transcriptional regulator with XRE-family HTH domain